MEVRRSSHCPAGVAVYCCQRQGAAVFHSQRPYAPQRRYRDYQCLRCRIVQLGDSRERKKRPHLVENQISKSLKELFK